jgi:hypothetical protein
MHDLTPEHGRLETLGGRGDAAIPLAKADDSKPLMLTLLL